MRFCCLLCYSISDATDDHDHEDSIDEAETVNSNEDQSDDFYGQTREIIIFAEQGNATVRCFISNTNYDRNRTFFVSSNTEFVHKNT